MKKLSIFDLKEGKVYAAFDGKRKLSKKYAVMNGKLMNAYDAQDEEALTQYDSCEWVPLKASISFQEIKSEILSFPTSILGLQKGMIYKSDLGDVTRVGSSLRSVSKGKIVGKPIQLDRISLSQSFEAIGQMKAKKAPAAKKAVKKK